MRFSISFVASFLSIITAASAVPSNSTEVAKRQFFFPSPPPQCYVQVDYAHVGADDYIVADCKSHCTKAGPSNLLRLPVSYPIPPQQFGIDGQNALDSGAVYNSFKSQFGSTY